MMMDSNKRKLPMIKQYNTSANVVQMVTVTWPHFRLPSANTSS